MFDLKLDQRKTIIRILKPTTALKILSAKAKTVYIMLHSVAFLSRLNSEECQQGQIHVHRSHLPSLGVHF